MTDLKDKLAGTLVTESAKGLLGRYLNPALDWVEDRVKARVQELRGLKPAWLLDYLDHLVDQGLNISSEYRPPIKGKRRHKPLLMRMAFVPPRLRLLPREGYRQREMSTETAPRALADVLQGTLDAWEGDELDPELRRLHSGLTPTAFV